MVAVYEWKYEPDYHCVNVWTSLIPSVLESGYNFDFFDDEVLMQTGRVEKEGLAVCSDRAGIER